MWGIVVWVLVCMLVVFSVYVRFRLSCRWSVFVSLMLLFRNVGLSRLI